MIKTFWYRISNLDRLSYVMNIAFGLSLVVVMLYFQFTTTVITTPTAIVELDYAIIAEPVLGVRIVEFIIGLGLIVLGVERLKSYKRR